jgi:hypothetical protein
MDIGMLPQTSYDICSSRKLFRMGGVGSSHRCKPADSIVRTFSDFLVQDSHGSEVSYDVLEGSWIGAVRHGLLMAHGGQWGTVGGFCAPESVSTVQAWLVPLQYKCREVV